MPEATRDDVDKMTGPIVLEFGTSWCPHCQGIQSSMANMRTIYPQLQHLKIEDGPGKRLGRSFHVKLWPTLIFMNNGQIVSQLVRPSPEEIAKGFAELVAAS
jgi:thioredoxin 1